MKRPFTLLGAVVLTASFINLYIGVTLAVLLPIIFAIILLLKSERKPLVLLLVALLTVFVFTTLLTCYKQQQIEKFAGEQIIAAKVLKVEQNDNYKRITVSAKVENLNFKAELYDFLRKEYTEGDTLNLKVNLEKPSESIKAYLFSNRVYLSGTATEILGIKSGKGIYKGFYHITNYIETTIKNAVGYRNSAPLIALITGNTDNFDYATNRAIRASGASHIMVVSGLHLGIICGALISFLKRLKAKPKTIFLAGVLAILLVLGVCGFHISAIRAAVTYIVMLLGLLIKKRADALNSLGFAVFLITLINPQIAGSVSFLLSVFATFGVVYLSPLLTNILLPKKLSGVFGRFTYKLLISISVSLSALICILPILIFTFGYISIGSIFVNLLITYAVNITLIATVIGAVIGFIPLLSTIILTFAAALGNYVMWVINLFGASEIFVFYFDTDGKIIFSVLSVITIVGIILLDKRKKRKEAEYAY